jgi:type IV pilus assembly protein PilE
MNTKLTKPRTLQEGFTLVELMIVVAIVGILSAIAYPNYVEYIQRSHRAEMKSQILSAAQWMERNYSITQSYLLQPNGGAVNNAALAAQSFYSPRDGALATARYVVTFQAGPTANSYTLQAVPQGAQTGDLCGSFRLDNRLIRTITGTRTVAECWGK